MDFIITVDTEGDNLWNIKQCPDGIADITNRNGEYIERFQQLCEKYQLIPTYFVNHEMTKSEAFVELGKEAAKTNKCEIGMHMHAWNSPPISSLPKPLNRKCGKPYAGEYASSILYDKMEYLHNELEETFDVPITSHRGGRWYFDERILDFLIKKHYLADSSITPGLSWEKQYGNHMPGKNYKNVKMQAYELDAHNILGSGETGVIEIPTTIVTLPFYWTGCKDIADIKGSFTKRYWLRPDGKNLKEMLWVMHRAYVAKQDYMHFMIHSSELMPGGSPRFKTVNSIERLYYDMEVVFATASRYSKGTKISDYAQKYMKKKKNKIR